MSAARFAPSPTEESDDDEYTDDSDASTTVEDNGADPVMRSTFGGRSPQPGHVATASTISDSGLRRRLQRKNQSTPELWSSSGALGGGYRISVGHEEPPRVVAPPEEPASDSDEGETTEEETDPLRFSGERPKGGGSLQAPMASTLRWGEEPPPSVLDPPVVPRVDDVGPPPPQQVPFANVRKVESRETIPAAAGLVSNDSTSSLDTAFHPPPPSNSPRNSPPRDSPPRSAMADHFRRQQTVPLGRASFAGFPVEADDDDDEKTSDGTPVAPVSRGRTSAPERRLSSESHGPAMDGTNAVAQSRTMTDEHKKLLYLMACYSQPSVSRSDTETWVGRLALLVLIYEAVVHKVLDYDFAPASEIVRTRRVYLNISQEGRDDIDDLIEMGLVQCLKLSSTEHQSITAYCVMDKGRKMLPNVSDAFRKEVDGVIRGSTGELIQVQWSDDGVFQLIDPARPNEPVESSITDVEDVSYVSSPFLPLPLLDNGRIALSSYRSQANAAALGTHNIRDDLDEVIVLDDCRILVGEYMPFGTNHMVHLNEKLGTSERVQGGFFTSVVTDLPTATQFQVSPGSTSVAILDFDRTEYLSFEAEVHYPEEPGIVQLETFGVHVQYTGSIIYGLRVESILDRVGSVSLDHLARLLCDVHQDSSKVMDNLVSSYQRKLLDMTYFDRATERDKFNVILAESIEPHLPAAEYLDKEEKENELKQILGDTQAAHNLGDGTLLVVGRHGVLVVGKHAPIYESVLTNYLQLMGLDIFMNNFFTRIFILEDHLKHIAELARNHERNPNSMTVIRGLLNKAAKDVISIEEIHAFLLESLDGLKPAPQRNPGRARTPRSSAGQSPQLSTTRRLATARSTYSLSASVEGWGASERASVEEEMMDLLDTAELYDSLLRRAKDVAKKMGSARHDLQGLRDLTDVLSETQMFRLTEAMTNNTKSLEEMFRSNERASSSLEVMQVILSGTLAFELLDRLSIADQWAWVAQPFLERPGAWFLLNLVMWGIFAGALIKLMAYLTDKSAGVLAVRLKLNLPIDVPAFMRYLQSKPVAEEESELDADRRVHKVVWTEPDDSAEAWFGSPPKIELTFDTVHGFLHKAFIQLSKNSKHPIKETEARNAFLRQLVDAGIVDLAAVDKMQHRQP